MNEIKIVNPNSLIVDKWEEIDQDEIMITTMDGNTEPYYYYDEERSYDEYNGAELYYKNESKTKIITANATSRSGDYDDPEWEVYDVKNNIELLTPKNEVFSKQWWAETLQLNEVSDADVIDRVITGFKLVRDTKSFGNAYRTKTGKASISLAKQIHAWIEKNFPNNKIRVRFEKTQGVINLNEGTLHESPPIEFETDDYEAYVNQNRDVIEKAAAEFNLPIQDMMLAFVGGTEVVLSDDIWSKLENSKSYKVKSLDDAIQLALKAGVDPKPYIDFIKEGKELPLPMILCYTLNNYYLVGGDIILSLYKALGSIPTVLQGTLNLQTRSQHEPLEEEANQSIKDKHADIVKYFIKYATKELDLKQLPTKITLSYNTDDAKNQHSFGHFDPSNDRIWVYVKDRNTADFLRTLAHELVHRKQAEDGRLEPDSGKTGSDIENEANAQAGVLLRKFGKEHEDIYETLNEIKINNPSNLILLELGDGNFGLLVEDTYLFTDHYDTVNLREKYEIVDASIEIDEDMDDKEYISISFPEPSFGGGASEADVNDSYDYWEANCAIGEKVLTKYSYDYDQDYYKIYLDNVTNADLLNEIKINNPGNFKFNIGDIVTDENGNTGEITDHTSNIQNEYEEYIRPADVPWYDSPFITVDLHRVKNPCYLIQYELDPTYGSLYWREEYLLTKNIDEIRVVKPGFDSWIEELYSVILNNTNLEEDEISFDEDIVRTYFDEGKTPEEVYFDIWDQDYGNFYSLMEIRVNNPGNYEFKIGDRVKEVYGDEYTAVVLGMVPNIEAALNDTKNKKAVYHIQNPEEYINDPELVKMPWYLIKFDESEVIRYWPEDELAYADDINEIRVVKSDLDSLIENKPSLNEYNFGLEQAFKWKYNGGKNSRYIFTTGQTEYEVVFKPDPESEGLYERTYKPVGGIANTKTGEGKPLPIIATVTTITLDFMERNNNWHTIMIHPISANRYRIVMKFLDENVPTNKYNIEEIDGIINITRKLNETFTKKWWSQILK